MRLKGIGESTTGQVAIQFVELAAAEEFSSTELRRGVINDTFQTLAESLVDFFENSPEQELKKLTIEVEE